VHPGYRQLASTRTPKKMRAPTKRTSKE
jgi:hypothetical protein